MPGDSFFEAVLAAGSILSGFCGTFLSFRIQREANYHRQPALDFKSRQAVDIEIGLTHFTSAFLLLLIASACAIVFGFILPLFAIAGCSWLLANKWLVVAGLVAAQIFLVGYFWAELRHYGISPLKKLKNDQREWNDQRAVVCLATLATIGATLLIWWWLG